MMFDPLFPFRLFDLRPQKPREELVTGSRNRLMRLVKAQSAKVDMDREDKETGSEIKHYRPMEFVTPYGTEDPCIGIEYWVVFNYRKGQGSKRDERILRSQSNEYYVQPGHPIVGTLNGQNQGEYTAQLLRDIGLGMVARHIIIHIDASNAGSRVRRELFATNREGFKDGPILQDLLRVLSKMLEEDENLYALERQLTERLAKHETETTSEEVRRQVTRLLLEAGFQVSQEGHADTKGADDKQIIREARRSSYKLFAPLQTLPFPQVTRFTIVTPQPRMNIRLNDNEMVLVETDADAEYDRQGRISCRAEPNYLEMAAKAPLRGGRVRWRFRTRGIAQPGNTGHIIATITRPDGTQLTDRIEFEALPALEEKSKKTKGYIPPFKIIPINPDDNAEEWAGVWPHLVEGVTEEAQASVAYCPLKVGDSINVYYSTVFTPFKDQTEKMKSETPALLELFRTNYEVWICYHAILQYNSPATQDKTIDENVLGRLLEEDRIRVARLEIKQAHHMAELMYRAMKSRLDE